MARMQLTMLHRHVSHLCIFCVLMFVCAVDISPSAVAFSAQNNFGSRKLGGSATDLNGNLCAPCCDVTTDFYVGRYLLAGSDSTGCAVFVFLSEELNAVSRTT